jgi:hypothetical protein
MTDHETNPETLEQPNAETQEVVNPEGNETLEHGEAQLQAPEESAENLSPERISQLLDQDRLLKEANITDPKAFYADYTRKSQSLAEQERATEEWQGRESQYKNAIQGFMGQQEAQQDPEQGWWGEYTTRKAAYDEAGADQALRNYMDARSQRERKETLRDMLTANDLKTGLDEFGYLGDTNPQRLATARQSMTEKDWVGAQMLWERQQRGDLREVLNARVDNKATEDAKRARMDTLLGDGASGAVPGSADNSNNRAIDPHEFYSLAPAARKRKYGITDLPAPQ